MAKDDGTSQSAKQQDYHINNSTLSAESTNMKRVNINEKYLTFIANAGLNRRDGEKDPHPHSSSSSFSSKGEVKLVAVVPTKRWTTESTSSARGNHHCHTVFVSSANSFSQTPVKKESVPECHYFQTFLGTNRNERRPSHLLQW